MIKVRNLVKKFGDFTALNNISFDLKKGTVLAFLGPNGAGKTTTMRIITTFMPYTEGIVEIGGFDVLKNPRDVRALIGYLPEIPPLYPELRVKEYLNFVAKLKGIKKNISKKVDHIIEKCVLGEKQNFLISALSKGYRQRVGLAQALIHEPELLILDEPTSGLDPSQIVEIREFINNLGREHSLIISTHILSEASQLCSRVLIIDHGNIIASGSQQELEDMVNMKDRIIFRVSDSENAKKILESFNFVELVKISDNKVTVEGVFTDDKRARLVKELVSKDHLLYEMKNEKLSLEETFIEIIRRKKQDV